MKKHLLKRDATKMPLTLETLQERLNSHDLADEELSTIAGAGGCGQVTAGVLGPSNPPK